MKDVLPNPADTSDQPRFRSLKYGVVAAILILAAPIVMLFDIALSKNLVAENLPGDIEKSIHLCEFFAHGFGVAMILISVAVLVPSVRRQIPRVAICAIVSGNVANAAKCLVTRARPIREPFPESIKQTFLGWLPIANVKGEFDYLVQSFPSAHTATAFGLAMGLSWLFPRGRWLFFGFAVLAGLQRIVSQAHWPSDTLVGAGLAIGLSTVILYSRFSNHWFEKWENRKAVRKPKQPLSRKTNKPSGFAA